MLDVTQQRVCDINILQHRNQCRSIVSRKRKIGKRLHSIQNNGWVRSKAYYVYTTCGNREAAASTHPARHVSSSRVA